jgi:hypothetical protein
VKMMKSSRSSRWNDAPSDPADSGFTAFGRARAEYHRDGFLCVVHDSTWQHCSAGGYSMTRESNL